MLVAYFGFLISLSFAGVVSISADSVSVIVPGLCHSQGCNGHLRALLEAHIMPSSTIL